MDLDYYKKIFEHKSDDCQVVGTKLLSVSDGKFSHAKVFKVLSIVKIVTTLPDSSPTNNEIVELSNLKFEKLGGPEVKYQLKWQTKSGKIRRFTLVGQITPETLLDFETINGCIYVKIILHGTFS